MALIATYCRDRTLRSRLNAALTPLHALAWASSWDRFLYLLKERPVTLGLVDLAGISSPRRARRELGDLHRGFPNLGFVLLVRDRPDPGLLFQVGRNGFRNVVLLRTEGRAADLIRGVSGARADGVSVLVTRTVGPYLPSRERRALYLAMDGVHRSWSADEYAERIGLSRPFLSERLKAHGMPSAGHLLIWSRLLHAGNWLTDPARTAESVSRQLDYSSGAAFRRALKNYTGATPTEVIERGGFRFVLEHFRMACGLEIRRPSAVA